MIRALLLLAVLSTFPAFAGEDHLGSVSSVDGTPATFTATAGAALSIQCTGPVRYAAGSAGSPPTASATDLLVYFAASTGDRKGYPIQLTAAQDRISVISARDQGTGFSCQVYTQSVPPLTGPILSALSLCTAVKHTVVSVGTSATAVPVSGQSGRHTITVCVSAENSGSPKVKCAVDPAVNKPAFGLSEPGDVLQTGAIPCVTYAVDATHLVWCVSDTLATAVTTNECVSP